MEEKNHPFWRKILNLRTIGILFLVLVGFMFFVLLMDYVIMPWYTKHGQSMELPDVTDKPVDEGITILEEGGFEPVIQDSVYDEQFAPGKIIQQNPLPYSMVKEGRRVYIIVSIGEKPRYMPQLIGLTPQDAEFRLKEQGLTLNQVFYEFSDFYPRGVVINQSLPAAEEVERNQKVNITVSLGQAPTSQEIPNLVGKSLETAEKELESLGVPVGRIRYSYRPKLVPGTILHQSVAAGKSAVQTNSIDLIVSTDEPPPEENREDSLMENMENENEPE
ncbi:MAG: PASTA domain-containing protein [Calditrichaeota bacterium]|nr:PASTA domain-containing protein [Calditrichota bacterium]RQW08146.1 MAG: PASTA domain-containing protein [Calditrichota bacterium]